MLKFEIAKTEMKTETEIHETETEILQKTETETEISAVTVHRLEPKTAVFRQNRDKPKPRFLLSNFGTVSNICKILSLTCRPLQ